MGKFDDLPEMLCRTLAELPEKPGVYLMQGKSLQILYIGKAKNLRRRVQSYFSGTKDLKTEMLRRKVAHVEVLLCANDYEALILENNLIKKHKPKYNINLKDDKTYPLVCISQDEYPRIFKTRQIQHNGSEYFGPYPDGLKLETTLQLISELFPLRRCKGTLRLRSSPCLYYHMKQCLGPCIGAVSKEEYRRQVQLAKHLLQGASTTLQQELERNMRWASKALRFEEAARLRDQIQSLRSLQTEQSMELQERPEIQRDYLAMLQLEDYYFFTILLLRNGKLMGHHHYSSRYLLEKEEVPTDSSAEKETAPHLAAANTNASQHKMTNSTKATINSALVEFLCQYYLESGCDLPDELYLPELDLEWEDLELFLQLLQNQSGHIISIKPFDQSREAANDRLLLLRARENVIRKQQLWLRYQGRDLMLEQLRQAINLEELPDYIEGFDISHMSGQATVASLVVFRTGQPAKDQYRSFNLRSTEGRIDDVASIQEAVSRRYTRLLNEGEPLPDLILIDGGQGQANAAAQVLRSLGLDIPLLGLAKREEILFFPCIPFEKGVMDSYSQRHVPLHLAPNHPGLKLLQHLRDETHRWAHGKNRQRYQKAKTSSLLENVPGLGPKRSSTLLQYYGSLESMQEADTADLARIGKMGTAVAETLSEYLARRRVK